MPVQFKDYYAVLGVSRGASDEDIRKAFRKQARQFHPDVAKDKKAAEEKFKEINEANEVLSDPAKRRRYDELGANWKQGAEFRPPPGAQRRARRGAGADGRETAGEKFHFGGTGFSDFFEQMFGAQFAGAGRGGPFGEAQTAPARGQDLEADLLVTLDELLRGSVRSLTLRRGEDDARPENLQVKIPAGVREGQKLRLAGRGHPDPGGGPAGDLLLRIRYAKHPDFRVENDELYCEVELAPWEATLGATISVRTLDGPVQIRIPAGTQAGHRLRIRGRGLPLVNDGRGDLYCVIHVRVPEQLTAPERELWEKLAKESHFNPRE